MSLCLFKAERHCHCMKIKNMHAACHAFNTKIASTEGESGNYYCSSTQEVQFVNIFCSNFRRKLEESQINLVIHPLHSYTIQILCTITPNSLWWQNMAQSMAVMMSNSFLIRNIIMINCNFMFKCSKSVQVIALHLLTVSYELWPTLSQLIDFYFVTSLSQNKESIQ